MCGVPTKLCSGVLYVRLAPLHPYNRRENRPTFLLFFVHITRKSGKVKIQPVFSAEITFPKVISACLTFLLFIVIFTSENKNTAKTFTAISSNKLKQWLLSLRTTNPMMMTYLIRMMMNSSKRPSMIRLLRRASSPWSKLHLTVVTS